MEVLLPLLLNVDYLQILIAIMSFLFMLSELLGAIPSVKANSVFQLITQAIPKIIDFLKKLKGEKAKKEQKEYPGDELDKIE